MASYSTLAKVQIVVMDELLDAGDVGENCKVRGKMQGAIDQIVLQLELLQSAQPATGKPCKEHTISVNGQKVKNEPPHEKTYNLHMQKQRRRSASRFAVTAKLISAFVFDTRILQFLFVLNPKFQASSLLL